MRACRPGFHWAGVAMSLMSPPPARAGVRASVRYSPELGAEICARIAAGESEAAVARRAGMPSVRSIHVWRAREPEFGAAYDVARRTARQWRLAGEQVADQGRRWRAALRPRDPRGGSVSMLTPELSEVICARIAAGESVMAIGADPQMPCAPSIYGWARRNPAFREAYLAAKDIGTDILFDAAWEIALESTEATVRSDRLRVETLRWCVATRAPKKYGPAASRAEEETAVQQPTLVVIQRFADGRYADLDGRPLPPPEGEEDEEEDAPVDCRGATALPAGRGHEYR